MKKSALLVLVGIFVIAGASFLAPSERQNVIEEPSVEFVTDITTPTRAPLNHLSTTFALVSPTSVGEITSVFQNTSSKAVTAMEVHWAIHDRSGNTVYASSTIDSHAFGDEQEMGASPFLPSEVIEAVSPTKVVMPDVVERIDVVLAFVETPGERKPGVEWPAYGEVWPSPSEEWHMMLSRRSAVARFRSFLVRQNDLKGPEQVNEVFRLERERRSRIVPQELCDGCGGVTK